MGIQVGERAVSSLYQYQPFLIWIDISSSNFKVFTPMYEVIKEVCWELRGENILVYALIS